ncbi:NCS2 family permease [Neobittarella massiliensis]|uniref:NCS2 family permease n=2 Tax=Oscillospiraceae TaxID=216572 RepID=A0A8J6IQ11_9FIRM|nr:NCS2 family permease [Neobittarella massiliensis]MBC3516835.1 NCS2 family permease [Neobittarella massiliensis]SCJ80554.1 Putative permease yicO [uncultured Anaerotruncus sp.]
MGQLSKFFGLKQRGTTVKTELMAGLTTFMTMAYVLVVQPSAIVGFGDASSIVDINGVSISKEAILVTCAVVSGLITLLMGLYANMPFALSTGMGTNFMLGALLQSGSISFGQIMAIILVSGLIFLALSIFGIRDLIVRMMPKNIKIAIGSAIGFFIAYLGFKNTGIGSFADGIGMGDFTKPSVFVAIIGLLIIAALTAFKVKGALLYGIIATTIIGIPFGVTQLPTSFLKVPDASQVGNILCYFDFKNILSPQFLILIFVAFFGDFFSTLGTVLGVASKANMLDENGDLPGIQKPFLVDAIGTCAGALTGCTTITTFVESSSGVEEGGRTGLTAVTTAILFIITIFISPLFLMIPDAATGPALIFVGFLMISDFGKIDFSDFTEAFGPFVMIMFGIFTGSIASGIAAGIIGHVFINVITGKFKKIHPGMYVLCVPLILYFILG